MRACQGVQRTQSPSVSVRPKFKSQPHHLVLCVLGQVTNPSELLSVLLGSSLQAGRVRKWHLPWACFMGVSVLASETRCNPSRRLQPSLLSQGSAGGGVDRPAGPGAEKGLILQQAILRCRRADTHDPSLDIVVTTARKEQDTERV